MGNKIYLLMGKNGSGRTTVGQALHKRGLGTHITTSDLLAEARASNALFQVTDGAVSQLVQEKLVSLEATTVFLDGFPKTLAQLQALLTMVKRFDCTVITIHLDVVGYDFLLNRCLTRVVAKDGKVYNTETNPPPSGTEVNRRADDTDEAFSEMWMEYIQHTEQVLEELQKGPIYVIDASAGIATVFNRVKDILLGD